MAFTLSPAETRVLGCLIEKERITPENYPLSLNALTVACNQTTSRDPVVHYDDKQVEEALFALRQKKLATMIMSAGARVQKFRHQLLDHFELNEAEVALLCVLLLRGPQTPGELRSRTDRLHSFASVQEVEACLQALASDATPLVRSLPARPGQKENRFVQLLAGEPDPADLLAAPSDLNPPAPAARARIDVLADEVAVLKVQLAALREELAAFRKQFE